MKLTQAISDGAITVALSFELHPEALLPSSECLTAACAAEVQPGSSAQTLSQAATASMPLLLQAFEQAQITVAHSQAVLLSGHIDILRSQQSGAGGAA